MTERHTDPLDQAAAFADDFVQDAVAKQRRAAAPQQEPGEDGKYKYTECTECGEDIPKERLAMGRIRCVECQSRLEGVSKQYRKW